MATSVQVSSIESWAIDHAVENSDNKEKMVKLCYGTVPCAADEISSVLGAISLILWHGLVRMIICKVGTGNFHASIGSTYAPGKEYLIIITQ